MALERDEVTTSKTVGDPTHPCPRRGSVVRPMHLRVENLKQVGWRVSAVESDFYWYGHAQKVIPVPLV
jgi:hypothetical protein